MRQMTESTRNAIELARRIRAGELGRAISAPQLETLAFAIGELSRVNEVDRDRVDRGDWIRASGDVPCPHCSFEYWRHPTVVGFEWLHKICTGRLVKL